MRAVLRGVVRREDPTEDLERPEAVRIEFGNELVGRSATSRVEDAIVGRDRSTTLLRRVVVQGAVGLRGVPQLADDAHGMDLTGRLEHRDVEPPVRLQLGQDVPGLGRLDTIPGRQRDPLESIVVERRRRRACGTLFEDPSKLVDLLQVLDVELGDEVPATGAIRGLPLLLECRQRLADRCHADTEAFGDLLLQGVLARTEIAGDDRPAQGVQNVLGRGPESHLGRVHGSEASGSGHP